MRRALISVSDKTGVADFAKGLAGARGRDPLHRRHRGGAARGRARGDRRLRVHRPGRDPRRPGEDAAPAPARGAAGAARRPRAHGDAGARGDRADRPGLRQPLPLRGDRRRPRRRARGRDREHRHRRADDDPRRRQEPRRRRRRGQARVLRRGAAPSWRSPAARSPPRPGTGSPTRPSPRPPATTPRSAAGSRPSTRTSPNTWRSPTRRCSTSPTARTRTSGRRSTRKPACAATCSRGSPSCTAGRSPSTTCSTSTRPAAWSRTSSEPACAIVKHNNPCGVAIGKDALEAYAKALACDPMSAFGGVIAFNRPVSEELAEELHENFVEVLIAPDYEHGALDVLQQKEAIRILCEEERRQRDPSERDVKRVLGGLLIQDRDGDPEPRELMEVVTKTEPSEEQWRRHALRLDRRPPRPLQRDRDRQGRRHARHRRRPDEPRRLGPPRGREVPRRPRRGRRRPCSPAPPSPPTPSSPSPTAPSWRSRPAPPR